MTASRAVNPGLLVMGLLFIVGGLLLLGRVFGPFGFLPSIGQLWPLLLIGFGLARLLAPASGKRDPHSGLWFLMIGVWCAVSTWGLFGFSWATSWPLLVIGIGLLFVVEALWRNGRSGEVEDGR